MTATPPASPPDQQVTDQYWADAARHLARLPQVVIVLLDRHVAGPDGRCRECRSHVHGSPTWPCNLALLAQRAAAVPWPVSSG